MLKKELLEKIKDLKDEDEVKEIEGLAKSSELDVNKLTLEDFKQILENNKEIKGYNQSQIDSAVSKGVESFKTKKMPTYIEEAIKAKSNEGKTPEQLKLEELQNQLDSMQKEKTRAEMQNKFTKVLGEKGLSTDLIDFVLGNDDDSTNANIEKIGSIITSLTDNKVKDKLSNSSYVPPKSENNTNTITKEQFNKMGYKEKLNLYKTDQETYNNLINEGDR
ncbi:DUF4355 domain-containing protein [Inconstantimicrobium mannanitabidum]|uniref:Uncharacterized protein n=1 Tax=Inconstantimicrobium mannanitabidum TaxID=1604901 RepID=A0ACB5R9Q1_9CLOT|nr:DUF4355 domain-containing protein [Clostridium sp. TW13]GKX65830.1 hypothetical protein rsdtw13_10880 [Clostridium sp. TW13]